MDIYNAVQQRFKNDEAVSPVIAVILMVAITVVLAATVYVWVSGFASEGDGPEQASATAEGATVADSDVDWIRVSLTRGENAPYAEDQVNYTVLDDSGNSFSAAHADTSIRTGGQDYLCTDASSSSGATGQVCGTDFHDGQAYDSNDWGVGGVLYVPCQGEGDHSVTISIKDTTVLDSVVDCDTAAS